MVPPLCSEGARHKVPPQTPQPEKLKSPGESLVPIWKELVLIPPWACGSKNPLLELKFFIQSEEVLEIFLASPDCVSS